MKAAAQFEPGCGLTQRWSIKCADRHLGAEGSTGERSICARRRKVLDPGRDPRPSTRVKSTSTFMCIEPFTQSKAAIGAAMSQKLSRDVVRS